MRNVVTHFFYTFISLYAQIWCIWTTTSQSLKVYLSKLLWSARGVHLQRRLSKLLRRTLLTKPVPFPKAATLIKTKRADAWTVLFSAGDPRSKPIPSRNESWPHGREAEWKMRHRDRLPSGGTAKAEKPLSRVRDALRKCRADPDFVLSRRRIVAGKSFGNVRNTWKANSCPTASSPPTSPSVAVQQTQGRVGLMSRKEERIEDYTEENEEIIFFFLFETRDLSIKEEEELFNCWACFENM